MSKHTASWSRLHRIVSKVQRDDSVFATSQDQQLLLAWEATKRRSKRITDNYTPEDMFSAAWIGIQRGLANYMSEPRTISLRSHCGRTAHFFILEAHVLDYWRCSLSAYVTGNVTHSDPIPSDDQLPASTDTLDLDSIDDPSEALFARLASGLSPKLVAVARQKYIAGKDLNEIGKSLGCSKQYAHQLVQKIQTHFSERSLILQPS